MLEQHLLKQPYLIILIPSIAMEEFDERTVANLDVVLDEVCRTLPNNGGTTKAGSSSALKLLRAAQRGKMTLGTLKPVARNVMQAILQGRVA